MTVDIRIGDCRDVLRSLADESVHCVVTSPPYYGLRDYGTALWEGGDATCEHDRQGTTRTIWANDVKGPGGVAGKNGTQYANMLKETGGECSKCGALWVDKQIGLEQSPDGFIAEMVAVFREVRRVLRADGTLWLNLGDSYAGSWGAQGRRVTDSDDPSWHSSQIKKHPKRASHTGSIRQAGLKPKDLIGIPWRVAFALQADGWYLRQDIIWSKPNPMPESIRDRCTKAHEYIFLLSKSERYFYDADAIKEPASENTNARLPGNKRHSAAEACEAGDKRHQTTRGLVAYAERKRAAAGSGIKNNDSMDAALAVMPNFRNKRSVWTVGSEPFSEAHFATFPPALIEPCIKAGCPKGGTVLDPFFGAGTTGLVADRLQRNCIGIELNPAYAEMARRRILNDAPLLAGAAE